MTMLPLDGLRVVEVGRTSTAAYCGRLLADAGADVVKVEPPEGDPARRRGPFPQDAPHPERSGPFLLLNVNKRGVCLDLGHGARSTELESILGWADLLVTDFAPREAQRLGLTWRRLHRAHPRLSLTSISPFGESGPYRDYRVNDHVLYNMGGLAYATPGIPDHADDLEMEPPLRPATPVAELVAGAVGATATLLALLNIREDGRSRHIEVSAHEAVVSMVYYDVAAYSYARLITGRHPRPLARMPNAVMPCKDGHVVIVAPWDHLWDRFVLLLGSPDWASWEVFRTGVDRGANWDALYHLVREWTMRFTGQEILQMAQAARVPCLPAFTLAQAVDSAHERERGFFWRTPVDGGTEARVPGSPFIFSKTPFHLRRRAPLLGEHTEEVLGQCRGVAAKGDAPGGAAENAQRAAPRYWAGTDGGASTGERQDRLPLEGVRVVAIPFCAQLLGWMGAEVILVETRHRPHFRRNPPYAYGRSSPNTSGAFNQIATNKRSITLDLATPEGKDLARELVRISDVVVENYGTGTIDRMGLGYEELRRLRPDLIMLSLGAFGRTGEMSRYTSLHSCVIMGSGLAAITGYPGGRPRLVGSIMPDTLSGMHCCRAIVEALHHRARTGEGQYIEVSMSEVLTQLMPEAIYDYTANGRHSLPSWGTATVSMPPRGCTGAGAGTPGSGCQSPTRRNGRASAAPWADRTWRPTRACPRPRADSGTTTSWTP